MRRYLLMLCLIVMGSLSLANAEVEKNPLLDSAFSLLEEGNPFLTRYNEITGSEVKARFELGMPYFFGGKHDTTPAADGTPLQFAREPEYSKRQCWENTHFYRKSKNYLYGFDCSGFTQWLMAENGLPEHPKLDEMINQYGKYGKYHIFTHRKNKQMPAYSELASHLRVGDLLAAKKGARHIMMFIGTLRDYGYTEAEVGESLAPYLDYALVIHCGPNFTYTDRIQGYLDARREDPYYSDVLPPDGGVAVSIIGPEFKSAPNEGHFGVNDFAWFDLPDGTKLTIWDLNSATSFCWWRVGGV